MNPAEPLTPDFVHYDVGLPIEAVTYDESFVTVTWVGGLTHRFHHLFLVESSVGEGVIDPATRERLLDPTTIDQSVRAVRAAIDAGGHLRVEWTPGAPVIAARFHAGWLRAQATGAWRVDHDLPAAVAWDTTVLPELPTFDGTAFVADDTVLRDGLESLCRFGIARLTNVATVDGAVASVAERIGIVRPTSFGRVFDVTSKLKPDSTAYTSHRLVPHTDLPTREVPPGLQLLHCLTNTCRDGHSMMVDGFMAAERLRAEDRSAFDNLVRVEWVHTNRSPSYDYRWSAPILDVDGAGAVNEVRLLHALRTRPDVADSEIAAAYGALHAFTAVTLRPELAHRTLFAPGELMIFDNRRILHGRDGFDPTAGERHLQGCYVDRDDLHSRLRILARAAP